MSDGRQEQVGAPAQEAGTAAQYGAGGVQGGGSQPGPATTDGQIWWKVHPAGH
jgi:hypothetical protein